MNNQTIYAVLVFLTALVLSTGCGKDSQSAPQLTTQSPTTSPVELTLVDISGRFYVSNFSGVPASLNEVSNPWLVQY